MTRGASGCPISRPRSRPRLRRAGPSSCSAERALEVFERTDDGPAGRRRSCSSATWLPTPVARSRPASFRSAPLAHWEAFARNTGWLPPILLELAELDTALGEPERAPRRLTEALRILTHTGDQAGARALPAAAPDAPQTGC